MDPTKQEMLDVLHDYAIQQGIESNGSMFEWWSEEAVYWFANHYHGGQWSNLYRILSTSPFRPGCLSVGPDDEVADEFYELLVSRFGGATDE